MKRDPDNKVTSEDGVTYTPFIMDGFAGYEATFSDGRIEYVYLTPSGSSDDGVPTVFVYHGGEGDPDFDGALFHVVMGDDDPFDVLNEAPEGWDGSRPLA